MHILSAHDIEPILTTPLHNINESDRLLWPWNRNGQYSVQSGFHWAMSKHASNPPCINPRQSHHVDPKLWKLIWSMKAVPKINNFLWRAISNVIPTKHHLFSQHIVLKCLWVHYVSYGSCLCCRPNNQAITSLDRWLLCMATMDLHLKGILPGYILG